MARPLACDEVAYRAELDHLDDATPCKCGDCGATWPYDQLAQIGDCSLTPGDPSPAGRCTDPRCDSLTYPDRPLDKAIDILRRQYDADGNLRLLSGDDR